MNIQELDQFNLAESAKYKDRLNPTIWNGHEKLTNGVKDLIMVGLDEYCQALGLTESQIKDVLVAGKMAGYDYNNTDTIDVVVVAELNPDPTFREIFNESRYQFNRQYAVKIADHYVKFYVQPHDEKLISRGAYSVLSESWVCVPVRRNTESNDTVKLLKESEQRTQPIKQIVKKKKIVETKKPTVYGFKEDKVDEVTLTPDGVSQNTKMFLSEEPRTPEEILEDFIDFCSKSLELKNTPNFKIKRDPEWSIRNKTFGKFNNQTGTLEVCIANRHIMDTLRTVAHELTHQRQAEIAEMPEHAGDTGSDHENEANAIAGILMREYGQAHPELFAGNEELTEATGYIPTRAEANDPRFKMALTNDVQPGEIGRCANAFLLNTDSQGHPQELRADGVVQRMFEELELFKRKNIYEDKAISLSKLPQYHKNGEDELAKYVPERLTHRFALDPKKWESTFFSLTNKDPRKLKYYGPKEVDIVPGTLIGDMAIANQFYRATTPEEKEQFAKKYQDSLKPYTGDVSGYRFPELLIPK